MAADPDAANTETLRALEQVAAPVTVDLSGLRRAETHDIQVPESGPPKRLGLLGRGGMADVHLSFDAALRRHFAVKSLRAELGSGSAAMKRFVREAQLMAQLDHPSITPVHALTVDETGRPVYTMKLVRGQTLTERIDQSREARSGPGPVAVRLRLESLLELLLKLCEAVQYAHDRGVVHRDLKPDNVMVGQHGEIYLMDWGLAGVRFTDEVEVEVMATQAGTIFGTPMYMAPEQAVGDTEAVGPPADQFALGLILHAMICGEHARNGTGAIKQVLAEAAAGTVPPLNALPGERMSRGLSAIVAKACAPAPQHRYSTVGAFADDLRRWRDGQPVHARPDGLRQRLQRGVVRHARTTLNLLLILAALVALLTAGLVSMGVLGAEVYQQRALAREARLAQFFAVVDGRAQELDSAFWLVESQLASISSAASTLMQHGSSSDDPIYLPSDFANEATAPEGTRDSAAYERRLNLEVPVVYYAPGADRQSLDAQVRQLLPVRHAMRRAHLQTRMVLGSLDEAEAAAAWMDEPGPLRWTNLGTASGVLVEIPGNAWEAKGYDPRTRPWYTSGVGAAQPTWGLPFQEASTSTSLVPCSMQIEDADGHALGVASLSVSFSHLIDRYLTLDHPAVRETFLVDAGGHVLVRSSSLASAHRKIGLEEHYQTTPSPWPELPAAMARGGGVLSVDGGAGVLVHKPLSTTGWSYVVLADAVRAGHSL